MPTLTRLSVLLINGGEARKAARLAATPVIAIVAVIGYPLRKSGRGGVFRNKRARAHKKVKQVVQPLIGICQMHCGLPPLIWFDEYFLGFVEGLIYFHLKETVGERLSADDRVAVSVAVLSDLSNLNGVALHQKFDDLASLTPKNPVFEEALDNAYAFGAYGTYGKLPEKWMHLLREPMEVAEALGQGGDRNVILAEFARVVFFDRVKDRS